MEEFAERLRSRSSFRHRRSHPSALALVRVDPRKAKAEELDGWADERFAKLGEAPSVQLLYSELLRLQDRYVELLQEGNAGQARPLQLAHKRAYKRLRSLLADVDPPLTTKPPRPRKPVPPSEPAMPDLFIPLDEP